MNSSDLLIPDGTVLFYAPNNVGGTVETERGNITFITGEDYIVGETSLLNGYFAGKLVEAGVLDFNDPADDPRENTAANVFPTPPPAKAIPIPIAPAPAPAFVPAAAPAPSLSTSARENSRSADSFEN